MSNGISTALALIDDRLDSLHGLLTDEPVDVVTGRYRDWKVATLAALTDVVIESLAVGFDAARGQAVHGRPTPQVYLDGAASRAFLIAMKSRLEADPAAVLRLPPAGATPLDPRGGLDKLVDLLERRLGKAFRGMPGTAQDVQNGFETLLAGASIAYEREGDSIVLGSRTYVPDFTFPGLRAALELKLCGRPDDEEEIRAEVEDEVLAYRGKYSHVVIGVYDLGFIRAPAEFARALTRDGVLVRVVGP